MAPATKVIDSDSAYAKRRKELLELIKQLRAIGAQTDLDLPRIAVIGNQSAGKSSLVEAISGITVPRDAGTCTRCPMECRLSSSTESWSCQVSIRWEYSEDGSRKDEIHEIPFGGVITDKGEVELALRRAQRAVLCPRVPQERFLTVPASQLIGDTIVSGQKVKPLRFSRNVVCVDLSGPELTDLSFVDLPGIIQNADPQTVQLVEDLVTSHIQGNCLILVTLPMSDDIENQKAARLAKQVDPLGLRTIGVLTKPDTLTAGATKSRELWLDVLEGRRFPLRHGYYCTRQPDDDERARQISSSQAREAETNFFAETGPWSTSSQRQRFGTGNLVANLSTLLTQIIDEVRPKLRGEVLEQLTSCTAELDSMPRLITTEPSLHVLGIITSFCDEVRAYVHGNSIDTASLVQKTRAMYGVYKRNIRRTAPAFVPYPNASETDPDFVKYLKVDDDDDVEGGKYIYLQDVRNHIRKSRTRELPNNVPYPAKVALIREFQSAWEDYSRDCFEDVWKCLQQTLAELSYSQLKRYDALRSHLQLYVEELMKAKREETLQQIVKLLKYESIPFTLNDHYLSEKHDKCLARYKDARAGRAKPELVEPQAKRTKITATDPISAQDPIRRNKPVPGAGSLSEVAKATFGIKSNTANAFAQFVPLGATQSTFGSPTPKPTSTMPPSPNAAFNFTPVVQPFAMLGSSAPSSSDDRSPPVAPSLPRSSSASVSSSRAPVPSLSSSASVFGTPFLDAAKVTVEDEERQKQQQIALAALTALGYNGLTPDDFGKLNPPDFYEEELQVMAEVRAYFQVAYKRVIDYIPLSIDHGFLYSFAGSLQTHLIEKLGLGASNATTRCAAYVAEDPNVVATREELMARKKRLESVQTQLFNFGL